MKKNISCLIVAFIFSFLCFSSNVNAKDITYDNISIFDSIFTNEQLEKIDVGIREYREANSLLFNYCHFDFFGYSYDLYRFECGNYDIDSMEAYWSNDFFPTITSFTDGIMLVLNLETMSFSHSNLGSGALDIIKKSSDLTNGQSYPFWSLESKIYSGTLEFSYPDDIYSSISENYKKYYNFQNIISPNQPFYTIINLRLGNWKGYTGNVDLVYCIDSVCEESPNKSLEYKYGVDNEIIDLSDMLDSEYNGYLLDSTKTYEINANVTTELKVYYYSTEVDYTINYYYDDVLQESLTEVKKGSVNSVVTLTDLDEIKDNIYFLDKEDDYSITLSDSEENVINVYYYSKDVAYSVNVYLDDIFYQSHSYVAIGKVGSEIILENLSETIGIYSLDVREYKISLTENSEINYINVYYYSSNYDTKYQDIDTSNKFYISFDWVYIKELFNLKGEFIQTEQFVIVYVVNFLFYAIVGLFIYVGLKMLNKLFSFFKMF